MTPRTKPRRAARRDAGQAPAPSPGAEATRGGARRLAAIGGAALGAYAAASAAIVYAFGVRELGYSFFDVSDIAVYFQYATAMASGARPYVDFPVEYPPLAVSLFAAAGPPDDGYGVRFAAAMFLLGGAAAVVTAAAAARAWPSGRRPYAVAAAFAVAVLATGALLGNRFDAAVALVFATALLLLAHRVEWAAAGVLGLGFALKLVPAILLPLVLVLAATRRRALAAAAAFAAAAALPFLVHLPGGLAGLARLFAFHGVRPLQIESVLATPYWLGQLLGLVHLRIVDAFGGQNVGAPGADALARASGILGLAALALAYVAVWRARERLRAHPADVALAVTAVLLAFLTTGKVLSPQFLIWLLPCAALLAPSRPLVAGVLVVAMALTQIEFPASYWGLCALEPLPIVVVVGRNVALAAAFVLAVVRLWRLPPEPTVG